MALVLTFACPSVSRMRDKSGSAFAPATFIAGETMRRTSSLQPPPPGISPTPASTSPMYVSPSAQMPALASASSTPRPSVLPNGAATTGFGRIAQSLQQVVARFEQPNECAWTRLRDPADLAQIHPGGEVFALIADHHCPPSIVLCEQCQRAVEQLHRVLADGICLGVHLEAEHAIAEVNQARAL